MYVRIYAYEHQERHACHPPRIGVRLVTMEAVVSRRVSVLCVSAQDFGRDRNARIRLSRLCE